MPTVELTIPPRSVYVGVIRLAFASLARKAGLGEEAVDDLRIAVSEACANAVTAHQEAGSTDNVSVTWDEDEDSIVVEVWDRRPKVEADADGIDTQGFSTRLTLSLALLESLVDGFELNPREGGGMRTKLMLNRHRGEGAI